MSHDGALPRMSIRGSLTPPNMDPYEDVEFDYNRENRNQVYIIWFSITFPVLLCPLTILR